MTSWVVLAQSRQASRTVAAQLAPQQTGSRWSLLLNVGFRRVTSLCHLVVVIQLPLHLRGLRVGQSCQQNTVSHSLLSCWLWIWLRLIKGITCPLGLEDLQDLLAGHWPSWLDWQPCLRYSVRYLDCQSRQGTSQCLTVDDKVDIEQGTGQKNLPVTKSSKKTFLSWSTFHHKISKIMSLLLP